MKRHIDPADLGSEELYMLVDPESREAHRAGKEGGPHFFSTEQRALEFAAVHGLADYDLHTVPSGVLARLRGRAYYLDGEPAR